MKELDKQLVKFIEWAKKRTNHEFKVICGVRTLEQQQELYKLGRTKKGKIVTNCDGIIKKSKHQLGKAVDIAIIKNNKITWDTKYYIELINELKKLAKEYKINLNFGADFKIKDFGHIEVR